MRAAVLEQAGKPLVIDDVDIEAPHTGEVAVAVHACGICHSDLSVVDGAFPALLPTVLGHEAAGVVTAIGEGVTTLAVGDHVVLTPCAPCGHCYWCVRGEWSICTNSDSLMTAMHPDGGTRLSREGGETVYRGMAVAAFAEAVVIQETGAVKIPDDVPLDVACVIGCAVQTGVGAAINTAGMEAGATALVLGLGGIGLSIVQGAVLAGASRIIVSDPVADRRAAALAMGATDALDPTSVDVATVSRDLTDGIGVDYAFDALGRSTLITTGLDATRKGGTTVLVGVSPMTDPLTIPITAVIAATEKKLIGCLLGSVNSLHEIPRLIALWRAGRLDLEALITDRRPLDEINEAFDDLREARGIRTVLQIA